MRLTPCSCSSVLLTRSWFPIRHHGLMGVNNIHKYCTPHAAKDHCCGLLPYHQSVTLFKTDEMKWTGLASIPRSMVHRYVAT